MFGEHRILLIGGSSHVGIDPAQSLASHLGWNHRRQTCHPGRPWQAKPKKVPNHVADHYLLLSADELTSFVITEKMWSLIKDIVTFHATDVSADRLVLEGRLYCQIL